MIPDELAKGFGFFQSKPSSSFSPVAVTPDELDGAWDGVRLHLNLNIELNGHDFGANNAGRDMNFDFATLIMHAAKTRALSAGTIIGSGTVSNRGAGGLSLPLSEGGTGYSCIAEQRCVEMIRFGAAKSGFLKYGNVVRIDMKDGHGHSVFGAIEQTVEAFSGGNVI